MPTPAAQVERQRRAIRRLALAGIAALLFILLAIWAQSYYGRRAVWAGQVVACERSKLDREDNASGWEAAEKARRASWGRTHEESDLRAAQRYAAIVASLRSRTGPGFDCQRVLPPPPLFELREPPKPPKPQRPAPLPSR